jgi:antitoxin (DNA-binding transcriptional repressor) of toxin-antitoxin stability system
MKTLETIKATAPLAEYVRGLSKEPVILTVDGRPVAALVSIEGVELVEFEPDAQVGFVALSRMQRELAELLQRPVDLVPKEGLKPKIREAVLASAEVVYAA